MVVFFIIVALLLAFAIFKIVQTAIENKYRKFVEQNSRALETLNDVNRRFVFFSFDPISLRYDYDNDWNFGSISCKDYLTYWLNNPSFRNKIVNQIQ